MRAILFPAVSSQPQTREISLDQQESDMRAYCAARSWTIVDILRIPGHSRSESNIVKMLAEYRKKGVDAYERLQDHWAAEDFDILLAYDPSRLARSMPLFTWVATCTVEAGAEIHFVIGGSPIANEDTSDFAIALGGIAATAGIKRLIRMRHAKMDEFAARGLPTTSRHNPAYVLIRNERGKMTGLALDDSKRLIWDDLARLILSGCSYNELQPRMAALGHVNSASGKPYGYHFFYRWLFMPSTWGHSARNVPVTAYIGQTWPFDESAQPPDDVKLWRNTHPPVYSGDQAEAIKAELRRRSGENAVVRGRAAAMTQYAFSGLLICQSCASRLSANNTRYRMYWSCNHNRPSGRHNFANWQPCALPATIADDLVRQKVHHFLNELKNHADPNLVFSVKGDDNLQRVALLETELKSLEAKVRAIASKLADPRFEALSDIFNSELTTANDQVRTIRRELSVIERAPISEESAARRARTLDDLDVSLFWTLPPHTQNQTLRRILGEHHRFAVAPDKRIYLVSIR